jgi:hypothetical protein
MGKKRTQIRPPIGALCVTWFEIEWGICCGLPQVLNKAWWFLPEGRAAAAGIGWHVGIAKPGKKADLSVDHPPPAPPASILPPKSSPPWAAETKMLGMILNNPKEEAGKINRGGPEAKISMRCRSGGWDKSDWEKVKKIKHLRHLRSSIKEKH